MAWPENEKAAVAADRGHLRASYAGREQIVGTLKAAFVQGRLTKDEFDARIGRTLTSRTCAELAAVTADLPAARPPRQPPRRQVSNAARWGTSGLFTPALLAVAFALAPLRGDGGYEAASFVIALVYFVFWLSVGADLLWQWHCASGARTPPPLTAREHPAQSGRARLPCGDAARVQAMFRQG